MMRWLFLGLLMLALAAPHASAQVTLDRYNPAPSFRDGFAISRPDHPGHLRFSAQLQLTYANEPLVWEARPGNSGSVTMALVEHQVVAHVIAALALWNRALLFVQVPTNLVMKGEGARFGLPADGASLGNVALGARVRLFGEPQHWFALGLQGRLALPSSAWADDSTLYSGESKVGGRVQLLAEIRNRRAQLTVNAGTHFRNTKNINTLDLGSELMAGLGGAYQVVQGATGVAVHAELYGSTLFEDFAGRESSPVEALLGSKLTRKEGFGVGLAGTIGLSHGYGAPTYRLIAALSWLQPEERDEDGDGLIGKRDACPHRAEDRDAFEDGDGCPDPDNDRDAIVDVRDKCPNEREDADGFEDEDGCPEPDNDGDGRLDADDACPVAAEDSDGFEDADGCPDPDNDSDGVLDAQDKCPADSEDRDQFQDDDGCPEPDNDGDGVLDGADQCPLEAETQNGREDEDGCPDKIRVDRAQGQIFILEPVQFAQNSATILAASHDMLREIAQAMIDHPEIAHLRVEGHTDAQGSDVKNQRLSEQRAQSVLEFLAQAGVARDRLSAQGFGESQPIADNKTAEGRAKNRRVEFRL